ncbi:hypothetical protein AB5J72_46080 [Streptomyces sp. CG1]|uniref:hypothetical protein n=1 Tax=Streptomyces sp. CG1 TaxID=1287523 RepID=UPI0034E23CB0
MPPGAPPERGRGLAGAPAEEPAAWREHCPEGFRLTEADLAHADEVPAVPPLRPSV